jgi:hypothetical protein
MLRGTQDRREVAGVHAWLFVRAQVEGSQWYAFPREIVARRDGAWEAEIDLGGPPNIRHELRIGVLDAEDRAELVRFIAAHPNEPLEDLPETFEEESRVIVTRT